MTKMRKFTRDEGGSFEYRLPKMGELVQMQEQAEQGDIRGVLTTLSRLIELSREVDRQALVADLDPEEMVRWQEEMGNSLTGGKSG